jgi:hypothetical protein
LHEPDGESPVVIYYAQIEAERIGPVAKVERDKTCSFGHSLLHGKALSRQVLLLSIVAIRLGTWMEWQIPWPMLHPL